MDHFHPGTRVAQAARIRTLIHEGLDERENEEHGTTKLRRLPSAATTKLELTLVSVPRFG